MPAQTSWTSEVPAVNRTASLEIQDAKSARDALDSNELCGSGLPSIVGNSAALRGALAMVRIVAPTDTTVLIMERQELALIAQAIQNCSKRSHGPFVKVDCAAIPAGLLESELFGHERGAYTWAVTCSIGRFERANRGTLFWTRSATSRWSCSPSFFASCRKESLSV
jgi:transcriptional regulator with GAF, ATPase, and Fis domain